MTVDFNENFELLAGTKDFCSQLWNCCISAQQWPLSPADFEILDS